MSIIQQLNTTTNMILPLLLHLSQPSVAWNIVKKFSLAKDIMRVLKRECMGGWPCFVSGESFGLKGLGIATRPERGMISRS